MKAVTDKPRSKNAHAQKAHREKKAAYVKALEERVKFLEARQTSVPPPSQAGSASSSSSSVSMTEDWVALANQSLPSFTTIDPPASPDFFSGFSPVTASDDSNHLLSGEVDPLQGALGIKSSSTQGSSLGGLPQDLFSYPGMPAPFDLGRSPVTAAPELSEAQVPAPVPTMRIQLCFHFAGQPIAPSTTPSSFPYDPHFPAMTVNVPVPLPFNMPSMPTTSWNPSPMMQAATSSSSTPQWLQ